MTASDSVETVAWRHAQGAGHTRVRRHPHAGSAGLRRHAAPRVRRPPRRAPGAARRAPGSARRRRAPDFLPETREIREGDWTVAPIPPDLQDRRVEITGPVDRKMIINALNSGAKVFMADFEDANSPTWDEHHPGPDQPARRGPPHDQLHEPRRQGLPAQRADRDAAGAPARLAPGREARASSTASRSPAASSTSASTSSTTRKALLARGSGPVLLPAEDGEPPGGAALERCLRAARRSSSACPRARSAPRC